MKLDKHIALRFLTDNDLAAEIVSHMYTDLTKHIKERPDSEEALGHKDRAAATALFISLSTENNRTYVITDTVLDKLDMLKVKKNSVYSRTLKGEELSPVTTYDWMLFDSLTDRKVTFILPDNSLVRFHKDRRYITMMFLKCDIVNWERNEGHIDWTIAFIDHKERRVSANWPEEKMQAVELYIYRLFCFLYLSENTEEIVPPGHRYGTRKSGKVVNSLPVPVTVVNSKWNVTSIRTEGFDVSGHFRLQPMSTGPKMIFIQPFRKHGYVRRAKNETES
jgi:hypothetical protein